ncbi:MAG: radical SAM protein [Luteitalea sp.]
MIAPHGDVAVPASRYPARAADRDRWVVERRAPRPRHDPWHAPTVLVEPERSVSGEVVDVATIFLVGRECPWRCVMCDLWQHTIAGDTPRGAIPAQVRAAMATLRAASVPPSQVKLYNAGSWFDRRAVPPADDGAVAEALDPTTHVIVESHPALIGSRTWRFRDALAAGGRSLEVAIGLETAHPTALAALNKRLTLDGFARAAARLTTHGVSLRVFLLIHPPWIAADQQQAWLRRSVTIAFDCGASVVSLVPLRSGHALEALATEVAVGPPTLADVERSVAEVLDLARGRLFVDLWDAERLHACTACGPQRRQRLLRFNLDQALGPSDSCARCGEVPAA